MLWVAKITALEYSEHEKCENKKITDLVDEPELKGEMLCNKTRKRKNDICPFTEESTKKVGSVF